MIQDIIDCGQVDEVLAIVQRLQDFLPEYGRTRTDAKVSEYAKAIVDLEDQLARQRALFREEVGRLYARAKSNWTAEEITKATGYQP